MLLSGPAQEHGKHEQEREQWGDDPELPISRIHLPNLAEDRPAGLPGTPGGALRALAVSTQAHLAIMGHALAPRYS